MRYVIIALCLGASLLVRADYAIHDGDTVVFLGDSITAARTYGKYIEDFTLLRYPDRTVKFINAGKGGETAHGALARLDDAVFGRGATVLTVAYGINDIGWGMKADAAHRQAYLDAIGQIVDRCREHHVRVLICSAAITAEDPDRAERSFLQAMCDEGLALARSKGAGTIDVQRTMRQVQRRVLAANAGETDPKKQTRLHVDDGIHLNDLGQLAMAYAILKGLDAPSLVSSATVDAASSSVVASEGCKVADVTSKGDELSFTRTDRHLPLNLAPFWALQQRYIPMGDELSRYMLTVKNLRDGRYDITAGGRALGTWSAADLARGVNLASATADAWQPGGPWDAQAHALKVFTDMRDELVFARRAMSEQLTSHPKLAELQRKADGIEQEIIDLQRAITQPIPVTFVLRRRAR
jgi:lysophospholipase L1-like esterase